MHNEEEIPKNQINLAKITHLSSLIFLFYIPFIIKLIPNNKDSYSNKQAIEVFYYQFSIFFYSLIIYLFVESVQFRYIIGITLYIFNIIFLIKGFKTSSKGILYKYPLTFRFLIWWNE